MTKVKEEKLVDNSILDILKNEAIRLGMSEVDLAKFKDEDTLRIMINTLKANQVVVSELGVTAPVVESPKENKADEKKWRNKADRQKEYFDSQEKITVMIPLEPGEKPGVVKTKTIRGREETYVESGAVWSKTFNGYRVVIPKGTYTPVARGIAENLSKELNQTMTAGDQWKIDRIDPSTGRPVKDQLV